MLNEAIAGGLLIRAALPTLPSLWGRMVIGLNGDPIGALFDRPSNIQPEQVYSFSDGMHINVLGLNDKQRAVECWTSASAFRSALQVDRFPVLGWRAVANTDHFIEG